MSSAALDAHDTRLEATAISQASVDRGESLAASALVAAAVDGSAGSQEVARLVKTAARLTGSDPLRLGLLALADPLLLASPLGVAVQANATLLAGLAQLDAVAVWTTGQGSEPTICAHAGALSASLTGGGLARAICDASPDEPVAVVHEFAEPCAAITWVPGSGDPALGRVLVERAALFLGLAFERASLLDGRVAQHAALARSAERRLSRVALDLHDGPLQDLALLRGELASLRTTLAQAGEDSGSEKNPLSQLEDLQAIAEATEADLRELATSTDATKLLRRPFDDALRGLAAAFALRSGIEPLITLEGSGNDLTAAERGALLRVIGEALANAREHSGAARVEIRVSVGDDTVAASIADDGCGFEIEQTLPAAARRGSMGLLGMVERVRHLGGTCQVEGRPGEGTTVRLAFMRAAADMPSLHRHSRPAARRVVSAA